MPVTITRENRSALVAAFTEWERRYREDPYAFESDVARILAGKTEADYGEDATRTLLYYLEEIAK